jgi:hypothetical protein
MSAVHDNFGLISGVVALLLAMKEFSHVGKILGWGGRPAWLT